jgi:hypothetical protein
VLTDVGRYLLVAVLATAASGQSKQKAAYVLFGDKNIPQIASGGGWKTTIFITSMDIVPTPYTVKFYGDNGSPMNVNIIGRGNISQFSGTLPAKGVTVVETGDVGPSSVTTGWALIATDGYLGVQAIFRQRNEGRPDFEAVVPADEGIADAVVLPFDNVGFTASMAIANPSSFQSATVTAAVFDDSGSRIVLDQFTMAPLTHQAFTLPSRWSQTANRRGSIEFTTTAFGVSILGLRFSGAGAFTSVQVMDSLKRP